MARMTFCSAQARVTRSSTLGTDPLEFQQARGGLLDDVEHRLAESAHQFPGEVRADPLDHAGAQVLLDAIEGARGDHPQIARLEWQPMLAIVDPPALGLEGLAGGEAGRRADDGDQLALPAHLHPQHTEAALGAMEGDALDGAAEALAGGLAHGASAG